MTGPALAAAHPYGSFLLRLGECVEKRRADGQALAVLFVDLDAIARADRLGGYVLGDAVRAHFSRRLRGEVLRAHDFLGEVSRDELACVLDSIPGPGVPMLAADKLLRVLDEPVLADVHEIYAQPAVGVVLFEGGPADAQALLTQARLACVEARAGGQRVSMYEPGAGGGEADRHGDDARLRAAVARRQLVTVYEPQAECRSGRLVSVEANLALAEGEASVVRFEQALRVAEAAGRATEFIERFFNDALRNCVDFRQSAGLDLRLSVGLPSASLRGSGFAELVARALKTWNLRAGRLTITVAPEAGLFCDEEAMRGLRELADAGVRVGLDLSDVGPSQLARLTTLPISEIRFSAAPFEAPEAGPNGEAIARGLLELAKALRMETLAVGVTSPAFADRLAALGCDTMQGPVVGPALGPAKFAERYGG